MSSIKNHSMTVEAVGKMNISGNVIPQTWYSTLKKETGKPYLLAIVILSDIVYWYRPVEIRDEITGSLIGYKKKFASDILQRNCKQLASSFGVSEKDVQRALVFLEQKGIIKRVYRQVETAMGILPKVMFVDLLPDGLRDVTYPNLSEVVDKIVQMEGQNCPDHDTQNVQYTKNTTQTTSKIITNNTPLTPHRGKRARKDDSAPKLTFGEYGKVKLTQEEYDRLCKDFGAENTQRAIAYFDSYIAEKGYKSKSHNLAMRRWVFDAVKEREAKNRTTPQPRQNGRTGYMQDYERDYSEPLGF